MSTLICSFDGLHDNRVLRYCADFEAHTLHMDTRTEAGEKVSVRFAGLLAHWFENVIQDNILFGMDEITVDVFFEQYKDLLGGTIAYGFPACSWQQGGRLYTDMADGLLGLRSIYPPGDCPAADGFLHRPESQGTGVV